MYSDLYSELFEKLIEEEGGFQKNPKDSGNYYNGKLYGTIYGIAVKYNPDTFFAVYGLWLKNESEAALELAKSFYYINYYNPLYDRILDKRFSHKIFDLSVNTGKRQTIKIIQKTINLLGGKVSVDGVFGLLTLSELNMLSQKLTDAPYGKFIELYDKYYRSLLRFPVFGKGWLNRLKRVFNWSKQ